MSQTLPLSHFEELMLHQDSAAYPASCFVKLRFVGRLDRNAFETAAERTIARHPLLHSVVEKQGRRYHWTIGEVAPQITWLHGEDTPEPELRRLDVTTEHGLRFRIRLRRDRSDVLIQFHHACCDGIAIYQVVRDLLIAYASEFSSELSDKLPIIDSSLLTGREATGLRPGPRLKLIVQQAARLPSVFNFFTRTPAALVPHEVRSHDDAAPAAFPAMCAHHFGSETSAALRASAGSVTTVNDILLRDLFLAIRDFRKSERIGNDKNWLRLMIPTSLRRSDQYRASAANMIGAVFVERRGFSMKDPGTLLSGIQRELDQIKRLKLGHLFNFALFAQRLLPGGLRNAARPGRRQVSAVFTNIGKILTRLPLPRVNGCWECGNVVLESTESAAPIARNMCSSFAATWYANRLSLTLHYDSLAMSPETADKMLKHLVQRVRNSANAARTPAQDETKILN